MLDTITVRRMPFEFPDEIEPGSAVLRWHAAPAQLRVLGGSA